MHFSSYLAHGNEKPEEFVSKCIVKHEHSKVSVKFFKQLRSPFIVPPHNVTQLHKRSEGLYVLSSRRTCAHATSFT